MVLWDKSSFVSFEYALVTSYPFAGRFIAFLGIEMVLSLTSTHTVYTIANFGSVILVTVTVTRKMLTMILSVVWYGHSLTEMQWLGVGLVFGGIGVEAQIKHQTEVKKAAEKAKAQKVQ